LKALTEKNKKEAILRLEVVPAGCSGFSYKFGLVDSADLKKDDKYAYYSCYIHIPFHCFTPPCDAVPAFCDCSDHSSIVRIFEKNGARVAVDDLSNSFLQSCTIDWEKSALLGFTSSDIL
jgi:Fe-S cluster assembly iron-binding protein IscA